MLQVHPTTPPCTSQQNRDDVQKESFKNREVDAKTMGLLQTYKEETSCNDAVCKITCLQWSYHISTASFLALSGNICTLSWRGLHIRTLNEEAYALGFIFKGVPNHHSCLVEKHIQQKAHAAVNSLAKSCSHAWQGESINGARSCHFLVCPLFIQRPILTPSGATDICFM